MINSALFWLVSINKGISQETSFESSGVLWYSGNVFFTSNIVISSWISIKLSRILNRKTFNNSRNTFVLS